VSLGSSRLAHGRVAQRPAPAARAPVASDLLRTLGKMALGNQSLSAASGQRLACAYQLRGDGSGARGACASRSRRGQFGKRRLHPGPP
jgi:hypothetical protein